MSRAEHKPVIMIAAGGTGGHVFPGLAVAQRLREHKVEVVWLGSVCGMESEHVRRAGLAFEKINIQGFRQRGLLLWLLAPWRLGWALLQAWRILRKRKPQAVLGLGGFAAAPGGLMAAALGIPLLIHEQNAVVGLANKLLAPLSRRVLLGFPDAMRRRNAQWVGNPVRAEITALPPPEERMKKRTDQCNLLVIGGSRGASVFNEVVPHAVAELPAAQRLRVKQQTGYGKLKVARAHATSAGVEVEFFEFINDISTMYAWADIVLCRAGALSVAEIAAAGVAAVLVPYPHSADDHQTANARFLVVRDAAVLIPQREFTPQTLAKLLRRLTHNRERLLQLAVNARQLAQPQADVAVADLCLQAMEK